MGGLRSVFWWEGPLRQEPLYFFCQMYPICICRNVDSVTVRRKDYFWKLICHFFYQYYIDGVIICLTFRYRDGFIQGVALSGISIEHLMLSLWFIVDTLHDKHNKGYMCYMLLQYYTCTYIQWSLYFKTTHGTKNMWSLYCRWSQNNGNLTQRIAPWDQIKRSYNQGWP